MRGQLSKLKVLYIDPTQGTGGATKSLLAMVKCLNHDEVELFLLQHLAGPINKDFIHHNVTILTQKIGLTKAVMFDPNLGLNSKNMAIRKLVKIVGMVLKQLNLFRVIILDQLTIIYAVKKHHIDIVHINSHRQVYLPFSFFCKIFNTAVIFHVRYLTEPPSRMYRWFTRFSSFFFVSKFVESSYLSSGTITKSRAVIYNGRFPDEFVGVEQKKNKTGTLKKKYSIPSEHKIVINISTLTRGKGQSTFVKAAAAVNQTRKDVTFMIVGGNVPYEEDIKTELVVLIRKHQLQGQVLLLGQRSDIPELLSQADVSVVATELSEALCGVNIETMAAEVPLVATDIGSVREVVIPEKTGLLVPPGDHTAMARAIMKLLNNEKEAQRMAKRGHDRFLSLFNAEVNTAQMIHYYKILAGNAPLPDSPNACS